MIHFNWTQLIPFVGHDYVHIATLVVSASVLLLMGLIARISLATAGDVAPAGSLSFRGIFETIIEFISGIAEMVMGEQGQKKVPFFATLFLFIFVCNLTGLFPGWTAATDNINTTFAFGLTMFIMYNYWGIKEHGFGYINQFVGPIMWLGVLMVPVELISHLIRPLSLGLRLKANIGADHELLGAFFSIFNYLLPIPTLFMGLFVAFMQAFVFTMMGMIYVSMAMSHDH